MLRGVITLTCVMAIFAAWTAPASAALRWTANGDGVSVYQEANWVDTNTNSPPPAGTIDPNSDVDLDLIADFGIPGGSNPPAGVAADLQLGTAGSLSVSGDATWRMAQNQSAGIRTSAPPSTDFANRPVSTADTSHLLTQFMLDVDATVADQSMVTFYGGGNPVNRSTVDLTGMRSSVRFLSESPSSFLSEHVSKFTVRGNSAVLGSDPAVAELGDNLVVTSDGGSGALVAPVIPRAEQFLIDIDSTNLTGGSTGGPIATTPGWTSLDATQPSNGDSVTVDGVTFTVFSADGSRVRVDGSGMVDPNTLTGDFIFDDGAGSAVGVLLDGLPDGLWEAQVFAFDSQSLAGDQIVGITEFGSAPETIFTTSFAPDANDPFVFQFHTNDLTLRDGFGIFTRENNSTNRARFNAIALTRVVPEPTTSALAGLAAVALLRRRRRSRLA